MIKTSSPKIGCIIQGNYRQGTALILEEISRRFDYVCLSTWEDEKAIVNPNPKINILINKRPKNNGYSNRNLQRLSVNAGIQACQENNCEYVLKLRTDMLPTNIDIHNMLEAVQNPGSSLAPQKILIAPTRIRSVTPDYFSCLPDFFQFGPIELISLLWSTEEFDLSQPYNPPPLMMERLGSSWTNQLDSTGVYFCAEQELYAWFQYRIEKKYGLNLDHENIMKNFFHPYDGFNMCWFGSPFKLSPLSIGFRPTKPGIFLDWWRPSDWGKKQPRVYLRSEIDLPSRHRSLLTYLLAPYLVWQILMQYFYFAIFLLKKFLRIS
jgi:hypothetical protein